MLWTPVPHQQHRIIWGHFHQKESASCLRREQQPGKLSNIYSRGYWQNACEAVRLDRLQTRGSAVLSCQHLERFVIFVHLSHRAPELEHITCVYKPFSAANLSLWGAFHVLVIRGREYARSRVSAAIMQMKPRKIHKAVAACARPTAQVHCDRANKCLWMKMRIHLCVSECDLSLNKQIKLEHRHQPPVSKSRLGGRW